jgi:hypothetical protein
MIGSYQVPPDILAILRTAVQPSDVPIEMRNVLYSALGRHISKSPPSVMAFIEGVGLGAGSRDARRQKQQQKTKLDVHKP